MTDALTPLFVNPVAGRGRAGRCIDAIVSLLDSEGIGVRVDASRAAGDIEQRVAGLPNGSLAIVAGGDGSIHEAVNGIMASAQRIALGVIPTGTGNDFAKSVGTDLDWRVASRELAARIRTGRPPKTIDVGRMNGRYFANGAGIGLDARVTRIARSIRLPIGDAVYLLAVFDAMRQGIVTPAIRMSGDADWSGPVTLVSVSNGPWIGGMFHIAPMADNRDGSLELLVAAPVSRRRIFGLLPRLMRGSHLQAREVHHKSIERVVIAADAPLESHLDGELQAMTDRFEFEVCPGALALL